MAKTLARRFCPSLCIVSVLFTQSSPAKATRPLMRTAIAINQIRMSIPAPFETVFASDTLGLDQEDSAQRKQLLKQAAEYSDLRHSRMTRAAQSAWINRCESPNGEDNPFCKYELEREPKRGAHAKRSRRAEKRAIANDLRAGRFDEIEVRLGSDVAGAVSQLENEGGLVNVAMRVADTTECVPTKVSTALAYKLEERFPDIESVELTKRLYRKSSSCGKDAAAAQASFRLGLIEIWQDRCNEIPELMMKVETTPEAGQYHARAKYWRYFCAMKTGNAAAKQLAKDLLIKDHPMSFQALAASVGDESPMTQILKTAAPQIAYRSIVRPDINPILRASEGLVRKGEGALAVEMLDRSLSEIGMIEPEVRLYLAVVLNRLGSALTKFKILGELFQDAPKMVSLQTLRLFFPLAYYDLAREKKEKVDPLLLLSLMRQESAFNKDARSIAGARGLMQVMPGTARTIASVRAVRLFDPSTNIRVGTKYFLKRLEQYGGDVELTLAAYNAGFSRVDQWRKRYPTDNRLLFFDFIPFRETRDYVSSILRNYFWYVKLYGPAPTDNLAENGTLSSLDAKTLAIVSANAGAAAGFGAVSSAGSSAESSEPKEK